MSLFQLKGDILSYTFQSGTTAPSASYSTYLSFSSNITGMTTGVTYTLYISHTNGKGGDVFDIIDLLDGVASQNKIPVKGAKPQSTIPSSRCAVTSYSGTLVFDILYDSGTDNIANDFSSYSIRVVETNGRFFHEDAVYFTYNYYGTGGDFSPINGGYYQATTGVTSGFGDISITGTTFFSGLTDLVLWDIDLNLVDISSLTNFYPLDVNGNPVEQDYGFIILQKEGSQISNSYLIRSSVPSTDRVKFEISAVTQSSETFTNLDGIFVSFVFNGAYGPQGASGTSGSSGSSGTSGSSGSSGTSGSSGSSGTSGSSGSSGTSGSSGSSGTSGSSGSSGSSGTSGSSGSSGTSGSSGSSGTSGSSGSSGTSGTSGTSGVANITNLGDNRVLTSTGVQGQANAEENLTFDGSNLRVTGDTFITSNITVSGSASILTDTYSTAFVLQPTLVNVGNVYNGTLFMDVRDLVGQDNTFLLMGEGFATDTIQSQQWGNLYCLSGNSSSGRTWVNADASAVSTSTGLLGVGIWDNTTEAGLLLRGFININSSYFTGTDIPGAPLYMSITGGRYSFDPPTSTGEIVRVVGYFNQAFQDVNTDILYNIYFNPSNDWIEL